MVLFYPKNIYTITTNVLSVITMTERKINISLKKSTHHALSSIGGKQDTYDDLVRMLLLNYDKSIFDDCK